MEGWLLLKEKEKSVECEEDCERKPMVLRLQ